MADTQPELPASDPHSDALAAILARITADNHEHRRETSIAMQQLIQDMTGPDNATVDDENDRETVAVTGPQ